MRANDDPQIAGLCAQVRKPARRRRPLALWRSERLAGIDASSIREVRRILAGRISLHHRSWPAARRGDAAAAIAVTLDMTRGPAPDLAVVDLALSAVLVAAWRGDAAAATVLTHVRAALPTGPFGRASRVPGTRPAHGCPPRR